MEASIGQLPGQLTAELPAGDDLPVGNVNFAEAEASAAKLTERGRQPASFPRTGSSGCPPKRNGNTRAAPGRRRPRRSATRSAAPRRTSRASRTTAASRAVAQARSAGRQLPGQRVGPPRHARQHVRDGAATGITAGVSRRNGSRPVCREPPPAKRARRHFASSGGAAAGRTKAGLAGRRFDCGSNRSGDTTTSAFASWRFKLRWGLLKSAPTFVRRRSARRSRARARRACAGRPANWPRW